MGVSERPIFHVDIEVKFPAYIISNKYVESPLLNDSNHFLINSFAKNDGQSWEEPNNWATSS